MAIGKRRKQQSALWVATSELPKSPGHPFYQRLNALLEKSKFDEYAEKRCERYYAGDVGRPGLRPGRYFRLLLVGYFEGLDSERGIAWRAADSLGVRSFLELGVNERAPDHSTISRTRRLIDVETHREIFGWVLERLAEAELLKGKTVVVDGTTLEANAAMRSIVRRDTGEAYTDFLTDLAKTSGVRTPTRAALARLDRRRAGKGSNAEWTSPADPDAKITKMKDGRTHLAHKAEHAVDLDSGAIIAVTVQDPTLGDTGTIMETLAALCFHNLFGRFPRLNLLSVENGSRWVKTLLDEMDVAYRFVAGNPLLATNIFIREDGRWRMVHHHSGPVMQMNSS